MGGSHHRRPPGPTLGCGATKCRRGDYVKPTIHGSTGGVDYANMGDEPVEIWHDRKLYSLRSGERLFIEKVGAEPMVLPARPPKP